MIHPTEDDQIRAIIYAIGAAIGVTIGGRVAVAIWATLGEYSR